MTFDHYADHELILVLAWILKFYFEVRHLFLYFHENRPEQPFQNIHAMLRNFSDESHFLNFLNFSIQY